jgi:hypothetical protein
MLQHPHGNVAAYRCVRNTQKQRFSVRQQNKASLQARRKCHLAFDQNRIRIPLDRPRPAASMSLQFRKKSEELAHLSAKHAKRSAELIEYLSEGNHVVEHEPVPLISMLELCIGHGMQLKKTSEKLVKM